MITSQNLKRNNFDFSYHLKSVNFGEKDLMEYAQKKNCQKMKKEILKKIKIEKSKTLLSKILYYDTVTQ